MKPFIRWVGGKRQILDVLHRNLPNNFDTYYEPFVGAGALLFSIYVNKAVINDLNSELIHVYKSIKNNFDDLIDAISELDFKYKSSDYYHVRDLYNKNKLNYDTESAALFLWVMKRCFNGLYRVNKDGEFNAAWSKNESIQSSIEYDNLKTIHNYLQNVEIYNSDFYIFKDMIKPNDFVFLDPPYDDSYTSYTSSSFKYDDNIRLKEFIDYATKIGCYVIMTNHPTDFIRNLYSEYNQEIISVRRSINSNGSNRTGSEIIIRNF